MSIINKTNKKGHSQMRTSNQIQNNPSSILSAFQNKVSIICNLCQYPVCYPKICVSCNQIFCQKCLINYYNQFKNCPICQQKHLLHEFQDFQQNIFIEMFKKSITKYKSTLINKQNDNTILQKFDIKRYQDQQQQKCSEHSIVMKYFCQDCSKPICSDCGMMSIQHKNHRFIRLNDIYRKIKQKLNNQLGLLTKKIFDTQQYSLKIKKKLQKLQMQHNHIKRYTQQYYILLIQKFQQQIKTKTFCLKQIQEKNNKQIQFYQSCRDSICEEIQKKTKNQLIQEAEKLATSFSMVICQPPNEIQIQDSFQTVKQLLPDYKNFQYCLHNFSLSTGGILYSDSFFSNGVEWRLKIYPKGNGVAKGKYLSVFVEMTKAQQNQKKYEYKIQLLNHVNSVHHIRREYCSAFDIGQCWGYNQFISLQELQNGFLNEDKLSFIMGIRNSDYRSLSFDQSSYISKLQQKLKSKSLQRQNYVEETNIIDDIESKQYSSKNNNSINNQTKFLKFLQNSSSFQERKNQRKLKQRQRQLEKGQKDQQYLTFQLLNQLNEDIRQKSQNYHQISQTKPDVYFQVTNNQSKHKQQTKNLSQEYQIQQKFQFKQKIKKDNNLKVLNNKVSWKDNFVNKNQQQEIYNERQKQDRKIQYNKETILDLKNKTLQIINGKQDEKNEKEIYNYQPKLKNQIKQNNIQKQQRKQLKTHKKEIKSLLNCDQFKIRQEDIKNEQKTIKNKQEYKFYFSNNKKNRHQQVKQQKISIKPIDEELKKVQKKKQLIHQNHQQQYFQPQQHQFMYKQQNKKYIYNRKERKNQQQVKKAYSSNTKPLQNLQQKIQIKNTNIRNKQYIKNSPPKFKNVMDQDLYKQKQISNILEQSKKLQGIENKTHTNIKSNTSGMRQSTGVTSFIKNQSRIGHLKIDKREQQDKA